MTINSIEKFLYDISASRRTADRYKEDPSAFLARYRLTENEQELILNCDVGEMRNRGANPMLTMGFWNVVRGPREMGEYIKRMKNREA